MNQAKEPKQLGNRNRDAIPRLADGKTFPTRLISAGEKAMLKAAEIDAALRKSRPPQAPEKAEGKGKEGEIMSGWARVLGHAF